MAAEDPSVSGVSGRYATALFELARDEKSVDAVKADLDRFNALLDESADLKRLVRSPVFGADVQLKAPPVFRAEPEGFPGGTVRIRAVVSDLFAMLQLLMVRGTGGHEVPYTELEKMVAAGEITDAEVRDDAIVAKFNPAGQWPRVGNAERK